MRHRIFLGLGVCLLVAGPAASARGEEAAARDEQALREAGIPADGPGLLAFFRNRTIDGGDEGRLKALVKQLGDDSFTLREQASRQLVSVGARAKKVLKEALENKDVEVARRAQECLRMIDQGASTAVVGSAVRVLARRRPAGAVEVLLNYLPSADDEMLAQEVRAALGDLAVRDGKADPALVAALADASPLRRGAAGLALARARAAEHLPAVRKLLADPDARVRLRVALALSTGREKDAVPVLIRLLDQLPAEEVGLVEDLLFRLAGEKAPAELPGADEGSRRRYREAWEGWWKEAEAKIDPAQLEAAARTLGFTLVVLLDLNQVIDLDASNRPRWQIEGLSLPLDVQLLPGEQRVLIAEHDGNRVTERDLKGAVKWEVKLESPLAAQRLPNGNTFIATRDSLVEVDKDGKVVFTYTRPGGERFMKAVKLRNGEIACVTQLGVARYVRLAPDGKDFKEVRSFGVDVRTSGGRIDVLPNGNVLIPELGNNRVVEYDAAGKVVRELEVEQPIAAVRLPNGHTLVTSMTQHRAVELDRAGKEVWDYRHPSGTRVTRALRR
jgi:hypothetical protein